MSEVIQLIGDYRLEAPVRRVKRMPLAHTPAAVRLSDKIRVLTQALVRAPRMELLIMAGVNLAKLSAGGYYTQPSIAGWSSQAARRAHNPKVASSNLAPATN